MSMVSSFCRGALFAGLVACAVVSFAPPAHAWWRGGYGFGVFIPPVVVAPAPVYVPPPTYYAPAPTVYAPPPVAYAGPPRVWIPAHWEGPYWVRGHWN